MSQQQIQQPETPVGSARAAEKYFPTRNDIPEDSRVPVVEMLNRSLADTTVLATQAKYAHWNVKGPNFYQLHLLFDELAGVLDAHADMLAERVTSLGGVATGTARMAVETSQIPEIPPGIVADLDFVEALANRVAIHGANLTEGINLASAYGDQDTSDLYNEISREVDKQLYFLESHLQTATPGGDQRLQTQQTTGGQTQQLGGGQQYQSPAVGGQPTQPPQ